MAKNLGKWSSLLLLAAFFLGCQPKDGRREVQERVLMHTSFEELAGWSHVPHATLVTDKAHTGSYSIRVDAQNMYSATYRVPLGELCGHRPRRLTVSAWVWVPSATDDAMIVTAIGAPGNHENLLMYKTIFLTDTGPYKKWKKVSRSFDMPDGIRSNSELIIYLWYPQAGQPVYADDFSLTELW